MTSVRAPDGWPRSGSGCSRPRTVGSWAATGSLSCSAPRWGRPNRPSPCCTSTGRAVSARRPCCAPSPTRPAPPARSPCPWTRATSSRPRQASPRPCGPRPAWRTTRTSGRCSAAGAAAPSCCWTPMRRRRRWTTGCASSSCPSCRPTRSWCWPAASRPRRPGAPTPAGRLLRIMPLRNLRPEDSRAYLGRRRARGAHDACWPSPTATRWRCRWSPTCSPSGGEADGLHPGDAPDVMRELLERFVAQRPSPLHRAALEVCAHSRLTTEALLRAALDADDAPDALRLAARRCPSSRQGRTAFSRTTWPATYSTPTCAGATASGTASSTTASAPTCSTASAGAPARSSSGPCWT